MRVIITGANSGIGKEAAILYARQNYEVFIFCRNKEKGEEATKDIQDQTGNKNVFLILCDMSLQSSIRKAMDDFKKKHDSVDVLINNAANFNLAITEAIKTSEGYEQIWATNHLGPYLLSHLAVPLLKKGNRKRIINICSKGIIAMPFIKINYLDPGFLNEKKYSIIKSYYQSKLAQEMMTISLSEELTNDGISVNAIKVPAVKVDDVRLPKMSWLKMKVYKMKRKFAIEPSQMAKAYFWLGNEEDARGMSGKIINEKCKPVKFAGAVRSSKNRKELVELSSKQTGL